MWLGLGLKGEVQLELEPGEAAGLDLVYFDTWRNGYPGEPLVTDCFIYMKSFGGKKPGIKTSDYALGNVLCVLLWAKSQDF